MPSQVLLCRKRLVAQVARVIDGTWIKSFALLTMSVQVKLGVSSVVTRTIHKLRRVLEGFLAHSFLVCPQVAFRCRIINALNLTRFDITIRAVLSLMCALLWFANFVLFLKILSQPLQRDSTSVWTPRLWSYKAYLVMNCIPQTLQTNSPTILMKYVAFLFLLGRPADTD